jgi:hypothetical protein
MSISCCIDVSRGTAYGLSISQLIFAVACIIYSPRKEVTVYTLQDATNITSSSVSVHSTAVHVQTFFGLVAAYALFFAMQTMQQSQNKEYDMLSNMDYSYEHINSSLYWNYMFWGYVLLAHLLTFSIVLQTCDLYLLLFCTIIGNYSLFHACLPRTEIVNITRENIYILGYIIGVYIIYQHSRKSDFLLWIIVIDVMLMFGHKHDTDTTMNTVINCRLFYTCCQSLLLCVYYLVL